MRKKFVNKEISLDEYKSAKDLLEEERMPIAGRLSPEPEMTFQARRAGFASLTERFGEGLDDRPQAAGRLTSKAMRTSDEQLHKLTEAALRDGELSRELVELLIDKVLVEPGNLVGVQWRLPEFQEVLASL